MRFLIKISAVSLVLAVFLLSCTDTDKTESRIEDTALPEGFTDFYVKFHRDTAFQMSHIAWPLKGIGSGFNDDGETSWTRDNWVPHIQIPSALEYDQTFNVFSDNLVVETIREKEGNNAMQRRFAKLADGWALIYYVEMQPVNPSK